MSKSAKNLNQLERFVELVKRHIILTLPLPTADELSLEFNISKRTAYRDLDFLRELLFEKQKLLILDLKSSDTK